MNTKNTYSTILSSTKAGRAGFYKIGTEIETHDHVKYTIRSAFEPEYPNGSKPLLLVCTWEIGKKKKPKFQFVILHKFPNQDIYEYGNIIGTTSFCTQLNEGKLGYEIKTNKGKYQVAHDFWFQGKHCFVCTKKSWWANGLEVLWYNPENDKYYKIMLKDEKWNIK